MTNMMNLKAEVQHATCYFTFYTLSLERFVYFRCVFTTTHSVSFDSCPTRTTKYSEPVLEAETKRTIFPLNLHWSLFLRAQLTTFQIWRRPDDKPLSELMMVSLLTHICVTPPQWVKTAILRDMPGTSNYISQILWDVITCPCHTNDCEHPHSNGIIDAEFLSIGPLLTNFSGIWKTTQNLSSWKRIWKYSQQNGVHFVSASLCDTPISPVILFHAVICPVFRESIVQVFRCQCLLAPQSKQWSHPPGGEVAENVMDGKRRKSAPVTFNTWCSNSLLPDSLEIIWQKRHYRQTNCSNIYIYIYSLVISKYTKMYRVDTIKRFSIHILIQATITNALLF